MQAINILIDLNTKYNIDKVKYEFLYLNTLQGNFDSVLFNIENLKNNFTLRGECDYIKR